MYSFATSATCAEMSSDIRIHRLAEALRGADGVLPKEFEEILRLEVCRGYSRMDMSRHEFLEYLSAIDFGVVAYEFSDPSDVEPLEAWSAPIATFGTPASTTSRLEAFFADAARKKASERVQGACKGGVHLKPRPLAVEQVNVDVDALLALVDTKRASGVEGERPLTEAQRRVLGSCVCDGQIISLSPKIRFEKRELDEFRRLLEAVGGSYRKGGSWVIDEHAGSAGAFVSLLLEEGVYVDRRDMGAFFTSDSLATEVVGVARIEPGMSVLEPNGGSGVLVKRLIAAAVPEGQGLSPADFVVTCEVHAPFAKELEETGACVVCDDFLSVESFGGRRFDRIVMNPPFSNNQDIAHVIHAMSYLKEDGKLVCITSPMFVEEKGPKSQFRELVVSTGAQSYSVDRGAFSASGYGGEVDVFCFDARNLPHRLLYPEREVDCVCERVR